MSDANATVDYKKIAQATGFSRQHVWGALTGKWGITLDSAAKLANAMGLTLDELHEYIEKRRPAA